jgi:hypothetical protein
MRTFFSTLLLILASSLVGCTTTVIQEESEFLCEMKPHKEVTKSLQRNGFFPGNVFRKDGLSWTEYIRPSDGVALIYLDKEGDQGCVLFTQRQQRAIYDP